MATFGIPPELQFFMAEWTRQIRVLMAIAWYRYLITMEYQRHLKLSPGEQYRRTLSRGAFRW